MDDDFAAAIRELNTVALSFETSGPKVAGKLDRNVRVFAHLVESNAKQIVAVDTGATRSSIGTDLVRVLDPDEFSSTATIGPQTEYAPHLELGTSRIAPRAFMGPSLDRYSGDFVNACERDALPEGF